MTSIRALVAGFALITTGVTPSSIAARTPVKAAKAPPVLAGEDVTLVELKDRMPPHWVLVNDVVFTHMADGRAYLVDGDSGQFLGTVPSGQAHAVVQVTPDGSTILVPSTFMSRSSRGARTDVVTWFALKDLQPGTEVEIPAKRLQALPLESSMPLTDDGRFMLIYNFTPEQSMTVVDVTNKRLVGETETPGCALAHVTGPRSFMMQCADGSLQAAILDENGTITLGESTAPLFTREDPATDKPVRLNGSRWLFITFSGAVSEIDGTGMPTIKAQWKLAGAGEEGWRPGGLQPYTYHAPSGRLYVLMHQGGPGTHKQPGTEIWVFDVASHQRLARLPIDGPATAISISKDSAPLLYTAMFGSGELIVRKPDDASVLRKIQGLGADLTVIQPAPVVAPAP